MKVGNQEHKAYHLCTYTHVDGFPIVSKLEDIIKEFELVFGDLACVISVNIIHGPNHTIVLYVRSFELQNQEIDWRKQEIMESPQKLF